LSAQLIQAYSRRQLDKAAAAERVKDRRAKFAEAFRHAKQEVSAVARTALDNNYLIVDTT